LILPINQAIN